MTGHLPLMIALLVILTSSRSYAWEKPRTEDILAMSKVGIVKLIVLGKNSDGLPGVDYGSGFVVSQDGSVISAAHVFSALKDVTIFGRIAYLQNDDDRERDNLIELKLISSDPGTDVALLKFSRVPEGMRPLATAKAAPNPGETVYVLGFPGGQNLSTSHPAVYQGSVPLSRRFQFHGVSNRGNSGGPIVNSDGDVVGIVTTSEDRINSVPVTNIYRGAPTTDFPKKSKATWPNVRSMFIVPDADSGSVLGESEASALRNLNNREAREFCNVKIPPGWQVRRLATLGFAIFPPNGSDLFAADFRFEFLVKAKELYVARQESRNFDPKFARVPYNVIPPASHSLALLKVRLRSSTENQDLLPILYFEKDRELVLSTYLYRKFNAFHAHREGANSAFLLCSANDTVNRTVFFKFCELFGSQAVTGYYSDENPCLPGTAIQ